MNWFEFYIHIWAYRKFSYNGLNYITFKVEIMHAIHVLNLMNSHIELIEMIETHHNQHNWGGQYFLNGTFFCLGHLSGS